MTKIIQIYIDPENKEIIRQAAERLSLTDSTFLRMVGLKEARKILQEEELHS